MQGCNGGSIPVRFLEGVFMVKKSESEKKDCYSIGAVVQPLCLWYEKNKRSMPWRDDATPYHVWISEIMLQQTRIEAVKGYYARFLKRLPTVEELAGVPEEELLLIHTGYSGAVNRKKAERNLALLLEELKTFCIS